MRILALMIAAGTGCAIAQTAGVQEIMARVAANQARTQELRRQYVYTQKQTLRLVRSNGKIAREERREYLVTPGRKKVKKHLVKFTGQYESKGRYTPYDKPEYHYKGLDVDADLINSLSEDLTNDQKSKDGISCDLFPLTGSEQSKYKFRLVGEEKYRGHGVYRVAFEPDGKHHEEDGGTIWKGEALIDRAEYQPVLITTKLAYNIPLAVKILLGTNIKGLGFTLSYEKFEEGLWFPVSYGGEFDVRGLFFYKRAMSVALTNSDFHKLDVNSTVAYATEDK
ncbi:MAG: hypothetical protein P4L56_12710 [Candidatus Sulfopaludibacter sp.]|nr:hypothetical protein [Candidatus Sulfopaludibacter sp.]